MAGGGGSRDEFARSVARMAVAQICESVGFSSLQGSAVETLADLAIRYLRDVAQAAHHNSNIGGRVESSVYDVILALEDVGPGGTVSTDASRPVAGSNAVREVMRYVEYSSEVPFAKPLPRFPVSKKRSAAPSFAQLSESPPGAHIPSWLPALPDPHTYRSTPAWSDRNGGKRDPAATRLEQAKQRRKAEESLISLHARLSKQQSDSEAPAAGSEATVENAFLAPPTSEAAVPVPRIPSPPPTAAGLVEAFAPVLDTVLELHETGNNVRVAAAIPDPKDRPKVVFHLEFTGKMHKQADQAAAVLGAAQGGATNNQSQNQPMADAFVH